MTKGNISRLPEAEKKRIRRMRFTANQRDFRLMQALRPDRKTVVAEGDSWFAYPPKNLLGGRSNVINWLAELGEFNLLQMSSSGDEAIDIMSGKSKMKLVKILNRYRIDTLLFSGGGNDVVGAYDFDYLLREGKGIGSQDFRDYLHLDRLSRRLQSINNAYRDLIDYCDDYSLNPDIRIVTHTYDYALPSRKGAEFLGGLLKISKGKSWMYPYLRSKNIPVKHHRPIVRHLIGSLGEQLLTIQQKRPDRIKVVDTTGTILPGEWLNEIHPGSKGFKKIAEKILPHV